MLLPLMHHADGTPLVVPYSNVPATFGASIVRTPNVVRNSAIGSTKPVGRATERDDVEPVRLPSTRFKRDDDRTRLSRDSASVMKSAATEDRSVRSSHVCTAVCNSVYVETDIVHQVRGRM